jgi:quinol monooxygenase YgiN
MYGTVAHVRLKQGQEKALLELMDEWNRDYRPNVKGGLASYVYKKDADPNEFILVAVFEDKKTYVANADSPEQSNWFQKFRALLESDPVWEDGEIISGP